MRVPWLVVAGTHSGCGKTTVATGLVAALTARGRRVAPFKVGPDFIDPGYHRLAAGRPSRNLDTWICGSEAALPLFVHGIDGCDIAVVEGVMGMFDGASGEGEHGSTAEVAKLLSAPVVLVVDASAIARSVSALVHGFRDFDRQVTLAGVVLNRVGSPGHADLLRESLVELDVAVVGALPRDDRLTFRSRHLGLVPVVEDTAAVGQALDTLGALVAEHVDLDAVESLAATVLPLVGRGWDPTVDEQRPARPVRIGVAGGAAFSFTYPENLEVLEASGAEAVPLDPLHDEALPDDIDGLYLGGGFPEIYAEELAANTTMAASVRRAVGRGLPTIAECGGLLYLCRSLDGRQMAGAIAADARMTETLRLGYVEATSRADSPVADRGETLRGHVFHYSEVVPGGATAPLWDLAGWRVHGSDGVATPSLAASYVHLHAGGDPGPMRRLVSAATGFGASACARSE